MTIADHLRASAFLALEQATQECGCAPAPRIFATRFARAYLWSLTPSLQDPIVLRRAATRLAERVRFMSCMLRRSTGAAAGRPAACRLRLRRAPSR